MSHVQLTSGTSRFGLVVPLSDDDSSCDIHDTTILNGVCSAIAFNDSSHLSTIIKSPTDS